MRQILNRPIYFFFFFIIAIAVSAAVLFYYSGPAEIRPESQATGISDPATDGVYLLVNENGTETRLPPGELFYSGNYYKNRTTGDVYSIIYDGFGCRGVSSLEWQTRKLKKINDIEGDFFSVYQKDKRYARDSRKVYFTPYPDQEPACSSDLLLKIVDGADPDSFEPNIESYFGISPGNYYHGIYARDSQTIFYGAEAITEADVTTFQLTEEVPITRDKNYVYLWNEKIPAADPETYTVMENYGTEERGTVYGKDKNHVFIDYCILKDIDPVIFTITPKAYTRDSVREDEFMDKLGTYKIYVDKRVAVRANSCPVTRIDSFRYN